MSRVLPPATPPASWPLLAYGGWTSIHNDDHEHDQVFDVDASAAERAASLTKLGWEGRLPTKKALLKHMLQRAEHEYAEHLLGHSDTPGEWCIECTCFCAGARDDSNLESEELDITNPHDIDGVLDIDDGSNSDLDDSTDA